MLPDYKVVIFDEAHTLEDVAADHLGLKVGRGGVEWLLNKLHSPRQHRGLLTWIGDEDSLRQVEIARGAAERFFDAVFNWSLRQPRGGGRNQPRPTSDSVRVREPGIVPDNLSEELKKLATCINAAAEKLDDEQKIEFTAVSGRALQLADAVRAVARPEAGRPGLLGGGVYRPHVAAGAGQRPDRGRPGPARASL